MEGLFLLHEFGQRFHNLGETGNKPSVIRTWAQEASNFVLILQRQPFPYAFQTLRIGGYPLG
jgi:hypothetical protein